MAAEAQENVLSRLYRVYKTVHQMLHDRGYNVSQERLEFKFEDFKKEFEGRGRDAYTILATRRDSYTEKIFVFFADAKEAKKKLGIKDIEDFVRKMDEQKIHNAIIVVPTGITPFASKAIGTLNQPQKEIVAPPPAADGSGAAAAGEVKPEVKKVGYNIEIFKETQLLVNITHHILVPKHTLLTDSQKQQVLDKYKLKKEQLPRIRYDDPVAMYYGLKPGQVVKIVRPSETAGKYVTYRLVTKNM